MAVLDDVCASQHGVREGADMNLKSKLGANCRTNRHYQDIAEGFAIHHYAGEAIKTSFHYVILIYYCTGIMLRCGELQRGRFRGAQQGHFQQ